MKRILKYIAISILSLLVMIIMALLCTQTKWFRQWIKTKAITILNEQINGEIKIAKIEGNFYSNIRINDLSITLPSLDTMLTLKSASFHYTLTTLLNNTITIDSIIIDTPHTYITQYADSTWNFAHLFVTQANDSLDKKKENTFTTVVQLNNLAIRNGVIFTSSIDTMIPQLVKELNVEINGKYTHKEVQVNIKRMAFTSQKPDFTLNNMSIIGKWDYHSITIDTLNLITQYNNISAKGHYTDLNNFAASLAWPIINLKEFEFLIPQIPLKIDPALSINLNGSKHLTQLQLLLSYNTQTMAIEGNATNMMQWLTTKNRDSLNTDFKVLIKNMKPSEWLSIIDLPLLINADIQIKGNGTTAKATPLLIKADLRKSSYSQQLLTTCDLKINYRNGDTKADWNTTGSFGGIEGNIEAQLKQPAMPVKINLTTHQLALHKIIPQWLDSTLINITLQMQGSHLTESHPQIKGQGIITNSVVEYIPIDTMRIVGQMQNGNIRLDSLELFNKSFNLRAKGDYLSNKKISAQITGSFTNTTSLSHYFTQPTQWETLSFSAQVNESIDTALFSIEADIKKLSLDTVVSAASIQLTNEGTYINRHLKSDTRIYITDAKLGFYKMDSAILVSTQDTNFLSLKIDSYHPGKVKFTMDADANIANNTTINLKQLELDSPNTSIHLEEQVNIEYSPTKINIDHFSIKDTKDSSFTLSGKGLYTSDTIAVSTIVTNFNFSHLERFKLYPVVLNGMGNLNLNIHGNRNKLKMDATVNLNNISTDLLTIKDIHSTLTYPGDTIHFNASILNTVGDSICMNAQLPLEIRWADSFTYKLPQTINAHIETDKTNISSYFTNKLETDKIADAMLNAKMDATGSLTNPDINGYINLTNGDLIIPQYGIRYNDVLLKLLIKDKLIQIDSLFLKKKKGYLLCKGDFEIDSAWTSGRLKNTNLSIVADKFQLLSHRDYNMTIDANTFFKNVNKQPQFGGNITVLQSEINIQTVMGLTESMSRSDKESILMQALRDTTTTLLINDTIQIAETKEITIPFMDQLTGIIKLNIPRNTWIRSDEMLMEIYGNLDIVKNSTFFELFGTVGINRGYYMLYGKKFNVESGKITFNGGEKFNININFTAIYVFRDANKEKREILLTIEGTTTEPKIAFSIDSQSITETDAMSYILFGQPFDKIGEQNQSSDQSNIPTRFISGLIATQLSKTIGNTLNLDMIEINTGDNWQNTTFMVGKYITNDLFVTYKRDFSNTDNQDITPNIITLEYEINRHLSLQLIQGDEKTSGIDVILKFEK